METFINYFSIGLGLILAIIGIILQIKSTKKKEIIFSIKSNNLISRSSSKLENLSILYKDRKVENLTVSKVLFYNRGAETITQQDLMTINHFSIIPMDEILDARLLKVNYVPNNVKLQHRNNSKDVYIDFDYLDQNHGAIIQIIHTGLSSDSLLVEGSIMGMKKLTEISPDKLISSRPFDEVSKKVLTISIVIGLIGYYFINIEKTYFDFFRHSSNILVGFLGLLLSGIAVLSWMIILLFAFAFVRRFLKSNQILPAGLEQFME